MLLATRILVVDDELQVRKVLDRTLTEAGYSVLTAAGAVEALRLLETPSGRTVSVVITDVAMPGMSGQELAARLLARSPAPGLVFITGFTSPRSRQALPGRVFDKPVQHDLLLAHVATLVESRPAT